MNIFGEDAQGRKECPVYSGLLKYFPDALAAVAKRSYEGGKQHGHNEVHWDRNKSADDKDALVRHIMEEDWDAAAWRALAVLQKELEGASMEEIEASFFKRWADMEGYVSKEISEPDEEFPAVVRVLTNGGYVDTNRCIGTLRKACRSSDNTYNVYVREEGYLTYRTGEGWAQPKECEVVYEKPQDI